MKPEEFEVYVIPPNFMEGGTLFGGLLKTRNTIEAVILGLAVGVPVLHLPFSLTVRVVILCLTALPLVLLALIGVSGMSLSAFIRLFFCFLHNRRILSRDGTQGGKNGKTLLPSWAQQRKSDCEAEDPPLPKSRSRFSVDLKQRSVTQFKTFLQEEEAVQPLNALADYRGKYYTLTDQRIPYRRDKTEDERFFILTLFAIAHEIEAMGQYSGSLMRVHLAVGLPPAHFGVQAKRFINYFNGRGAVAFQFKGKPYAIFIENTACFPQSFSAAAATVKNLASFPRALVVDIGGFTADYVRLRNGVPDMAACDSLENGVILLYNRICAKANAELDILLEESEIDRILRGEDQDAAPEVIALAEREAQEFINDLLSGLRERMLELKSGKVIFLGGGATLLRRQIEASGKTGQAIFVEDINANAKGYEYLYRLQHSGR